VIIFRTAFSEITGDTVVVWFSLDYIADFLYLMDILIHFRIAYLEDGVLQTDSTKLRLHYMNSTTFYVDMLCLLPLDFLYLSLHFQSMLRVCRLVKIYRFWEFLDKTERHTNYPNLFRLCSLLHYLLVAFHWNSCIFYLLHKEDGFGSDSDLFGRKFKELKQENNVEYTDRRTSEVDIGHVYLLSYYWTTLAMTTIGNLPHPSNKAQLVYVILQLLIGLMCFATILGYIASIVTNISAARKDFQAKLDGVKTYMRIRKVPSSIQNKVIKWFDYLWLTQKSSDEEKSINCLPDKLKGEIAIHVHLNTLKRVEIFQNTEAGFLCELVLRLKPVLFSPGDYICRKGKS
ncbi:cyclic nucleotide-gated channel cone photoreceptor subunit alpha, partial [Eurytemora carolleeae]|uniref:cyclic nucleotide-gated channel cone photoreceptor subunit alpha n=1 Tax=Eurytemora carolleeae TaxID=1294199 RepID=UPI000C76D5AB